MCLCMKLEMYINKQFWQMTLCTWILSSVKPPSKISFGSSESNSKLRKILNWGNLTLRSLKLSIKWTKPLIWGALIGRSTLLLHDTHLMHMYFILGMWFPHAHFQPLKQEMLYAYILWHICSRQELWSQQRELLVGNSSANMPVAKWQIHNTAME
jgi:hypothetical protein